MEIISVVVAVIGLVETVAIAVIGFIVKDVYKRIDDAKAEARSLVRDEERRRNDAFVEIKEELRLIHQDIKELMK